MTISPCFYIHFSIIIFGLIFSITREEVFSFFIVFYLNEIPQLLCLATLILCLLTVLSAAFPLIFMCVAVCPLFTSVFFMWCSLQRVVDGACVLVVSRRDLHE